MPIDPVALTADLIRCPSVTPVEGGALQMLQELLSQAGFTCTRVDRGGISNLFARWGDKGHGRSFGFNGHTDVVPLGDEAAWTMPPFGAEIKDGVIYGRGATDMKSGVAAFAAAAIGGFGSLPGALVGGLIVGLIEPLSARYAPDGFEGIARIAPYAILLLVLIFRPGGLFSQTQKKKV